MQVLRFYLYGFGCYVVFFDLWWASNIGTLMIRIGFGIPLIGVYIRATIRDL